MRMARYRSVFEERAELLHSTSIEMTRKDPSASPKSVIDGRASRVDCSSLDRCGGMGFWRGTPQQVHRAMGATLRSLIDGA